MGQSQTLRGEAERSSLRCCGEEWEQSANWTSVLPIFTWSGVTIDPSFGNDSGKVTRVTMQNLRAVAELPEEHAHSLPSALKECVVQGVAFPMQGLKTLEELDLSGKRLEHKDHFQFLKALFTFYKHWFVSFLFPKMNDGVA